MSKPVKALILIDHGSKVDEANEMLKLISERIINRNDSSFDIIKYCHMEIAHPTLEDAFSECIDNGANEITVHPYFLVPGRHSKTDIPNMVNNILNKYPDIKCKISEPLGFHEQLIDIILERSTNC